MTEVICALVNSIEHKMGGHPEAPERFSLMLGWPENPPYEGIQFVPADPAPHEDILRAHSPEMLLSLEIASSMGLQEIEEAPTFVNEHSCDSMRQAAGAVLKLERMILTGGAKTGFAIVRPPGHHADREKPMGFCLLNNTAIGVADALAHGCKKVAIIDFDGHHANGTQAIFRDDPRVGVFSIHQENIYPGSGSMQDQVKGRIINLPLPHNTGDPAFSLISNHILEPWLKRMQPDMLFISAGFDGHFADPLTGLGFSTEGYYNFAKGLKRLANLYSVGRLLFVLEGGYDPQGLKENIQAVLCALVDGDQYPNSFGSNPYPGESIENRVILLAAMHELI